MAIYLDEDFVGSHPSEIILPHLLLCMGVVCQMPNGRLVGCHISTQSTESAVLAELKAQIQSGPGKPSRLYMIADFSEHFMYTKLAFTDKARAIGYAGNFFVFDTQPVVRRDGAYARVVSSSGAAPCDVYVLADQDARPYSMGSSAKPADGHVVEIRPDGPRPPRFLKVGDSARPGKPLAQADFKIVKCN